MDYNEPILILMRPACLSAQLAQTVKELFRDSGWFNMCLSCSPFCGRCRPALLVAITCPSCGEMVDVERLECIKALGYRDRRSGKAPEGYTVSCPECDASLNTSIAQHVKPLDCVRSGIVCGYPCGRHMREFFPGDLVCEKQVPLGKIGSIPEATVNTKALARIKRRRMTLIEH